MLDSTGIEVGSHIALKLGSAIRTNLLEVDSVKMFNSQEVVLKSSGDREGYFVWKGIDRSPSRVIINEGNDIIVTLDGSHLHWATEVATYKLEDLS